MKHPCFPVLLFILLAHAGPQFQAWGRSPVSTQADALAATAHYLDMAAEYTADEEHDQALAMLLEAHRLNPEAPEVRLQLGHTYLRLGREKDTLEIWEPLSRQYPRNLSLRNNIAWLYVHAEDTSLRDSQRAVALARDALMINPLVYQPWLTLSAAYSAHGEYAKAMHAAKRARDLVDLTGGDEEARQQTEDAIRRTDRLARAVEAHPLPPPEEDEMDELYWVKLGEYAFNQGQFREALGAYGIALTHNPENRAALFGQALVYIATKQYDLALETLYLLDQRFPNDPTLKNNMAWLYATAESPAIRNAEKALSYAQEAIMLDPHNFQIWNTLSEAHYVAGNFERALRAAENSVRQAQLSGATPSQVERYRNQVERCRLAVEAMSIVE